MKHATSSMAFRASGLFLLLSFVLTACTSTQIFVKSDDVLAKSAFELASNSFVKVQILASYRVLFCNPKNVEECVELGPAVGRISSGSGGIILHGKDATISVTAAHVVTGVGKKPENPSSRGALKFLEGVSTSLNISQKDLLALLENGYIRLDGIETKAFVTASDGNRYQVNDIHCDKVYDVCSLTTSLIVGAHPLSVAKQSPKLGDRVLTAAGPFGYAYPGSMTPIFEGIYSGSTTEEQDDAMILKDYYTMQVSPGCSGSLILNRDGEIVGLVSKLMYGAFCPDDVPCSSFSAGIAVAVPHAAIYEFLHE